MYDLINELGQDNYFHVYFIHFIYKQLLVSP